MFRVTSFGGVALVLVALACNTDPIVTEAPSTDVALAKGAGQSFSWTFNGDVASDPAHPVATSLADVYLVFPPTTAGVEAECDAKSTTGATSNEWSGYSGAAWRGQVSLQKKGPRWHFGYQGTQLDADGGSLNLAVNDAATESTNNGVVTITFTNAVGLVSALSHSGGALDAADRCLSFSVVKTPN